MKRIVLILSLALLACTMVIAEDPLSIYTTGNVGIGTSEDPEPHKLGVDGSIKSSDRVYDATGIVMPVGAVLPYAGSTPPDGWLLCNGDAKSRIEFADLFEVLGETFGEGDGSTTFNLPNLQGVSPTGVGTSAPMPLTGNIKTGPALGEVREDQMQGHWHSIQNSNGSGDAAGGSTRNTIHNPNGGPQTNQVRQPVTDNANGLPRVGPYTHGPEIGLNFVIKY